jgi:hypothetical protein
MLEHHHHGGTGRGPARLTFIGSSGVRALVMAHDRGRLVDDPPRRDGRGERVLDPLSFLWIALLLPLQPGLQRQELRCQRRRASQRRATAP